MKKLSQGLHVSQSIALVARLPRSRSVALCQYQRIRSFHAALTGGLKHVKPFLLADIGEGIREVQIIQWFVQPGARVEEFDKLCEVQSDKASVEITSRFSGVIKRLHYNSDDMATVGKPLVDIDIQGEINPEVEALINRDQAAKHSAQNRSTEGSTEPTESPLLSRQETKQPPNEAFPKSEIRKNRHLKLATPAVRHLMNGLNVDITDVKGSGKEGRVLKEDVQRYVSTRESVPVESHVFSLPETTSNEDVSTALSATQNAMFKTMTRSLTIPHFLYSDTINTTQLSNLRQRLRVKNADPSRNISGLAFIVKALSQALTRFPILNARLELASDPSKPQLIHRSAHNIGVAVDTPAGLFVPVIHNVQSLSIEEIARKITELATLGREGRLSPKELSSGTFSVSNVGSIGGGVVSPVIVDGQMGIIGIGRARTVPSFDDNGNVVPREEMVLSWSADHRIIDGATVARCSEMVKDLLEEPTSMLVMLR